MWRVDVVEQAKFDPSRVFGKNRKINTVAEPGCAERIWFSWPGLHRCHKARRSYLSRQRNAQSAIPRRSAEFVTEKNRQQAQTDPARNYERTRGWFCHGEEQEERLHCFGWRL